MKEIHISIREGVALQTDHTPYITGDGEYRVVFDLEKEWEAHPLRTARFQTEGSYVDVVFRGNQCRVPVFTYARTLEVGIFAGNLRTTTPARIFLREGIRSAWGSPEAPAPNVYDQLMEALEDNGIVMEQEADGVRLTLRQRGGEQTAFLRYSEVYVGSGEMPEGYFVQVDPSGGTAVLHRMRELWNYLAGSFEGAERPLKAIRRAKDMAAYKAAAQEILRSCPLRSGGRIPASLRSSE